jgi:uncharacterized protein YkwD
MLILKTSSLVIEENPDKYWEILRQNLLWLLKKIMFFRRLYFANFFILLTCLVSVQSIEASESNYSSATKLLAQSSTVKQEPNLSQAESIIISQTNHFRQAHGLDPVNKNNHLTAAAEYFAHYMARTNKFSHTADGQQPADRARNHGYNYCIIAENIAYQYSSAGFTTKQLAERFVKGWEQSPEHRKNMLTPPVIDLGVAVARSNKNGAYFAVQMFGRPESKAIEFAVSNQTHSEIKYTLTGTGKTFSLAPRFTQTHRQCQPTQVQFTAPAQEKLYRARQGVKFVVSKNKAGILHIEQQPLAKDK